MPRVVVDERRVRRQRGAGVGHRRQVFVVDRDQPRAGLGRVVRLGHDQRDLVAREADVSPQSTGWSCSIRPKAL